MAIKTYGSVGGVSKEIKKLYGSVNGVTKEIKKLYGSANGVTKLIFPSPIYGMLTFYTDSAHTSTKTIPIRSLTDLNQLGVGSYTDPWSKTIDGETITNENVKSIVLTSQVTQLPTYFLCNCSSLDSVDISQTRLTGIAMWFLAGSSNFNSSLTLPATVTTIGNAFLAMCTSFNSNINTGNVTSFGNNFLQGDYSFNKPLDTSNATYIGYNFLSAAGSPDNINQFNQPLDLGKLTTLGSGFLFRCRKYNQDVVLPTSLTYIGSGFMGDMEDMVHTVYCNTSTLPDRNSSNIQMSLTTWHNAASTAPSYINGIKLGGTYKNEWKAECPDLTGANNRFRKLVVV